MAAQQCQPAAAADASSLDADGLPVLHAESSSSAVANTLTTEQAAELLTPDVLSLLLHASAGDPNMLFTVVSAVAAFGLTSPHQQQQDQQVSTTQTVGLHGSGLRSSESHSSSYTTVSSTISGISMEQSTGGQGLCRQVSRLPTGGSAVLQGSQALSGFAGAGVHHPASPSPGDTGKLQSHSLVSWSTGMLRSAVSDPEALRALGDHVAWREVELLAGRAIDAELQQLQKQAGGLDASGDAGSSSSGSSKSSQERMVLKQLHGAFSEPLGEVLQSPDMKIGRSPQQGQQRGSKQSPCTPQPDLRVQQSQQRQVASNSMSLESPHQGQRHAAGATPQKQGGRSVSGAVRKLQQLTGLVQQLSVSSPGSPQHPYMMQYKQQLQQQQQHYLHRVSQPGYSTKDREKQQQRQLRTVVSLPAAKMSQPQHPYMQNYQQQLQKQRSAREGTSGSPV